MSTDTKNIDDVVSRVASALDMLNEVSDQPIPSNHDERMEAFRKMAVDLKGQLAAFGLRQHIKGEPMSKDQHLALILDTLQGVQTDMLIELGKEQVQLQKHIIYLLEEIRDNVHETNNRLFNKWGNPENTPEQSDRVEMGPDNA